RLRFPRNVAGDPIAAERRDEAENAARAAIAALGLAAVAFQREEGFDLRSRCAFVPDGPLAFEVVGRDGGVLGRYALSPTDAQKLVTDASAAAADVGMGWEREPVGLRPAAKLVALIRKSREVAAFAAEEDAEEE